MASRRTNVTKVEVPLSPSTSKQPPSTTTSPPTPFVPTALEASLLAIYPLTLLLGSIFSVLHPPSRRATYIPAYQAYDASDAPSYFAKKNNLFNVYFVKIGWLWITAAFSLLLITLPSLGPPLQLRITTSRARALARYAAITCVWIAMTQWFFGPAIIDRSFRWTGGQCQMIESEHPVDQMKKEDMSDVREVFTHAACKAIGGQWRGGHDISGHVFLLILGSAMLVLESLPVVSKLMGWQGVDVRRGEGEKDPNVTHGWTLGVQVSLAVAALSWWMLFMTAAFFHTWFEKLTGLLVAMSAIYVVYVLPRSAPLLRDVFGLPPA